MIHSRLTHIRLIGFCDLVGRRQPQARASGSSHLRRYCAFDRFRGRRADAKSFNCEDDSNIIVAHAAAPTAILRGTAADGTAGHPVLFPRDTWPELLLLRGDQGARPVLARLADRVVAVALPESNATTDLDTPEDWANWRANRTG